MGIFEIFSIFKKEQDRPPENEFERLQREAARVVDKLADGCAEIHREALPAVASGVMKRHGLSHKDAQGVAFDTQILTCNMAWSLLGDYQRGQAPSTDDPTRMNHWVSSHISSVLQCYSKRHLLDQEAQNLLGYCSTGLLDYFLRFFEGRDVLFMAAAVTQMLEHFAATQRESGHQPVDLSNFTIKP